LSALPFGWAAIAVDAAINSAVRIMLRMRPPLEILGFGQYVYRKPI
jgi:hypothetical protein